MQNIYIYIYIYIVVYLSFCDVIYPHFGEAGILNVQESFCYKKQAGTSNAQI